MKALSEQNLALWVASLMCNKITGLASELKLCLAWVSRLDGDNKPKLRPETWVSTKRIFANMRINVCFYDFLRTSVLYVVTGNVLKFSLFA